MKIKNTCCVVFITSKRTDIHGHTLSSATRQANTQVWKRRRRHEWRKRPEFLRLVHGKGTTKDAFQETSYPMLIIGRGQRVYEEMAEKAHVD